MLTAKGRALFTLPTGDEPRSPRLCLDALALHTRASKPWVTPCDLLLSPHRGTAADETVDNNTAPHGRPPFQTRHNTGGQHWRQDEEPISRRASTALSVRDIHFDISDVQAADGLKIVFARLSFASSPLSQCASAPSRSDFSHSKAERSQALTICRTKTRNYYN